MNMVRISDLSCYEELQRSDRIVGGTYYPIIPKVSIAAGQDAAIVAVIGAKITPSGAAGGVASASAGAAAGAVSINGIATVSVGTSVGVGVG